jgi:hypothetical protein
MIIAENDDVQDDDFPAADDGDHFHEMQDASKELKTKKRYLGCNQRFIKWLSNNRPECLKSSNTAIDVTKLSIESLAAFLNFSCKWQPSECKKKPEKIGTMKSYSIPEGYRSALVSYFDDAGHSKLPDSLDDEFKKYLKGYKKTIAKKRKYGELKASAGKDCLSFSDYKILANFAFISESSMSSHFHLFLLMSWNLVARPDNTSELRIEHFKWKNDCVALEVPCHKGDETGEHGYNTKHIYSNCLEPLLDIFLALGIWVLTNNSVDACQRLFEASGVEENFNAWLTRTASESTQQQSSSADPPTTQQLSSNDLSSYSARKGAPFYATSIPGLVNVISVWLRAGWSLGGVLSAYIHVQDGGDQSVGRKIRPYSKIDPKALRSPKEKKHASMAKTVVAFIDRHLNLETYLVSSAEARDASFATAWSNVETEIFNVALEGNPALNRTSRITPLKQLAYNSLYSNFLTKVPRK